MERRIPIVISLSEHWTHIHTNNVIERLNWEICRTRVVGSFSDGNSVLMLVCTRLRHVAVPSGATRSTWTWSIWGLPLRKPPLLDASFTPDSANNFAQNPSHYLEGLNKFEPQEINGANVGVITN